MSDAEGFDIDWGPDSPRPGEEPAIHIYADLDGRINAVADRQFFEGHEQADVGVDHDAGLLVIDPGGDRQPLSISRAKQAGGDIATAARLRRLLNVDELEETVKVPLEERGGYVIGDVVSAVQESDNDAGETDDEAAGAESDSPDENESEPQSVGADLPFEPGYTSKPAVERVLAEKLTEYDSVTVKAAEVGAAADVNATWAGRAINELDESDAPVDVKREHHDDSGTTTLYHVSLHSQAGRPESQADAAVPDPDDSPSVETVRDCAETVHSIQELADLLELSEAEARFEARNADVYGQLRDNVRRMGEATDD